MKTLPNVVFCSLAVALGILPGASMAAGPASELTIQNTVEPPRLDRLYGR